MSWVWFIICWLIFNVHLTMEIPSSHTDDYLKSTCKNYQGRYESFSEWAEEKANAKPAARCRHLLLHYLTKSLTEFKDVGSNSRNLVTILDAGCGSGRDLEAFGSEHVILKTDSKNQTLPVEALGFDCAKGFVEKCKERGLNAVVADFIGYFSIIPHDKKFDAIFSLAALFHLPEAELVKVLDKFHMHLNPHGVILTSIPEGSRDGKGMDGRWMLSLSENKQKTMLEDAGFDIVHSEKISIYNGNNWLVLIGQKK